MDNEPLLVKAMHKICYGLIKRVQDIANPNLLMVTLPDQANCIKHLPILYKLVYRIIKKCLKNTTWINSSGPFIDHERLDESCLQVYMTNSNLLGVRDYDKYHKEYLNKLFKILIEH